MSQTKKCKTLKEIMILAIIRQTKDETTTLSTILKIKMEKTATYHQYKQITEMLSKDFNPA